jgi:hypothetical protein
MEAAMGSVLIISLQAAVCQHDVFLVFLCVLGMLVALLNTYEYVCVTWTWLVCLTDTDFACFGRNLCHTTVCSCTHAAVPHCPRMLSLA